MRMVVRNRADWNRKVRRRTKRIGRTKRDKVDFRER